MRITQKILEAYLWGSANILRGIMDAGDYKQYIFPLLFLKRISDVFDEEYNEALEESGNDKEFANFSENHRFQIPEECHWSELRKRTINLGHYIQKSMRGIEKNNPETLSGIFGDVQWTNKKRFSDRILKNLIEHFSSQKLSLENVPEDLLGNGYEYLIKQFANDSGHNAQEFYTNRTLVKLMTLILDPQPNESIYDPTCGSGGMLLIAALHTKKTRKEFRNLKLYGQEINHITSSIAKMNLFLHGIEDFHIMRGDTLSNPAFIEGGKLKKFDIILANPPYSIKSWNQELWKNDQWGRNIYGIPPQGRADYAFFQHILISLKKDTGRCAILFPHGVLFRKEEYIIRKKIIESDLIECVLGLGPKLFYNASMEACVIFCRTKKPKEKIGKIMFINAVNEVTKIKSQNFIENKQIEKIKRSYNSDNILHFSKLVNITEIRKNDYDLNINNYIPKSLKNSNNNKTSFYELEKLIEKLKWNYDDLKNKIKDLIFNE